MKAFDFITDSNLKKVLENSTDYIYTLFEETHKGKKTRLYKTETYRVIILYTISIIEAVLLYLYKKQGEGLMTVDYKFSHALPPAYKHKEAPENVTVIAVQKKEKKPDHEIRMKDLVDFFSERGFMNWRTAERISKINKLRNTFHLSKSREEVPCSVVQVESALGLLYKVVSNASKSKLKF